MSGRAPATSWRSTTRTGSSPASRTIVSTHGARRSWSATPAVARSASDGAAAVDRQASDIVLGQPVGACVARSPLHALMARQALGGRLHLGHGDVVAEAVDGAVEGGWDPGEPVAARHRAGRRSGHDAHGHHGHGDGGARHRHGDCRAPPVERPPDLGGAAVPGVADPGHEHEAEHGGGDPEAVAPTSRPWPRPPSRRHPSVTSHTAAPRRAGRAMAISSVRARRTGSHRNERGRSQEVARRAPRPTSGPRPGRGRSPTGPSPRPARPGRPRPSR